MKLDLELDREADGRWTAAVANIPGILVYGPTEGDAARAALALALRTLADKVEQGELIPQVSVEQVLRSREQFVRGEYVTLDQLKADLAES